MQCVCVCLMSRLLSILWQNIEQNFIRNLYVHFFGAVVGTNPLKLSYLTCFRFFFLFQIQKYMLVRYCYIVFDNILWPDATTGTVAASDTTIFPFTVTASQKYTRIDLIRRSHYVIFSCSTQHSVSFDLFIDAFLKYIVKKLKEMSNNKSRKK